MKGQLLKEYLLDGQARRFVLITALPFILLVSSCESNQPALCVSIAGAFVMFRSLLPLPYRQFMADDGPHCPPETEQQIFLGRKTTPPAYDLAVFHRRHPCVQGKSRHGHCAHHRKRQSCHDDVSDHSSAMRKQLDLTTQLLSWTHSYERQGRKSAFLKSRMVC